MGNATRDHVLRGVAGGFCQLSHGRPEALHRMRRGDWIIYYSSRESFDARHESDPSAGKWAERAIPKLKLRAVRNSRRNSTYLSLTTFL
ncbi:MAG: hypothetical protein DLM52_12585 [Chthoniobacterales bacterium]|nr:MAG: hypothetical protein DLM52_12585 [Chthoniobacterales bacterium]